MSPERHAYNPPERHAYEEGLDPPVDYGRSGRQRAQIMRVSERIGFYVLTFVRGRLAGQAQFRGADLVAYVKGRIGETRVAPGSPDRIMRLLKQRGLLNYRVVSRRGSLYEALAVEGPPS